MYGMLVLRDKVSLSLEESSKSALHLLQHKSKLPSHLFVKQLLTPAGITFRAT